MRAILCFSPLLAALAVSAWAMPPGLDSAGLPPPPGAVLVAPVNAAWAAKHTEHWRGLGFQGFAFEGILETALARAAAPEDSGDDAGTPPAPDDWDALLDELQLAVRRLSRAGLDKNFLHVTLPDEAPWFSERRAAAALIRVFTLAGECCRKTGLRGMLLDAPAGGLIFDPEWAAYPPDRMRVAEGAADTARRALGAFYRTFPEAELLLLADAPERAGPLWFPFFEGVLESIGAADIPLRVVLRETALMTEPGAVLREKARMDRMLGGVLSPENRERWRRSGGWSLALDPLDAETLPASPRYPVETFRLLRAAAKLHSSRYFCVLSPRGGWWEITPEEAEGHGGLKQSGPAAVLPAPALPETLNGFVMAGPFDRGRVVGGMDFQGGTADVLVSEKGAMLLAWDGLREPLKLDRRTGMVTVTRLATETEAYFTAKRGGVTVPAAEGAVLVDGLPLRGHALPAALAFGPDRALEAGTLRETVRFALANPTPVRLRGELKLVPPVRLSAGAAAAAVSIRPGARHVETRTLQGLVRAGETVRFEVSFLAPDAPPLTRSFALPVVPAMAWSVPCDGPLAGAPAAAFGRSLGEARVVFSSRAGEVACVDLDGRPVWKRNGFRLAENCPPAALIGLLGLSVAVPCRDGLRFLDADGKELSFLPREEAPVFEGLLAAPTARGADRAFFLLEGDGTLTRLSPLGTPAWARPTGLAGGRLAHDMAGRLYTAGPSMEPGALPQLAVFTADASPVWRAELSSDPVSAPAPSADGHRVAVGLQDGYVFVFDTANGDLLDSVPPLPGRFPSFVFPEMRVSKEADPVLVIVDLGGASGRGAAGVPLWSVALEGVVAAAALPDRSGMVAGLATGELVCLGADGAVRWRDGRAWGAVSGLRAETVAGGRTALLAGFGDRWVRALDAGTASGPGVSGGLRQQRRVGDK
ncbi:MAG: PQQ-binding-like beta-propeller repeat protein [Candidatus Hydrogenedentes bacterium]|nr:PQQ-binding-like beta-propeller repeat protein [Candidatus Hydrogenedentota bacterium]